MKRNVSRVTLEEFDIRYKVFFDIHVERITVG